MNKIAGAVLASLLFVKVLGIAGEHFFEPEQQAKIAFPVVVKEASTSSSKKEEKKGPSFEYLLAHADPAKGAKVFRKCQACHDAKKDMKNMTGPHLYDVIGRNIASVSDYNYSDALKKQKGVWTYDKLNKWLTDPRTDVPGTKMSFAGLPKTKDRAEVIAYLRQQNDNPPPLPKVPEDQAGAKSGDQGAAASGDSAAKPAAKGDAAAKPAANGGESKSGESKGDAAKPELGAKAQ